MLNNSVVSFYNFGLIFRGSVDKETNRIENWLLSTTPLLIGASSSKNRNEYLNKLYSARNCSLWRTL